ncbi:efflux transporter outer membrane subunit [Olivibacter sitiensis]|uniref:efflux transporter outer membrane subunit n=1 Tax=Olivibacter sitiensis TaxID=376470 RepID=UPI000486CF12|nr:efflux transporter outer membrane subunit [Olivibacter sitiensis]
MTQKIKYRFILLALLALSACKVAQDSTAQLQTVPQQYRNAVDDDVQEDTTSIASIPWNDFFTDPVLLNLIDSAIANNNDLQLAVNRINTAQWQLRQAKAGNYPEANLQIAANSSRPSDNSLNGLSLNQFLGSRHIEDFTTAVNISWEADIWGKIRGQKAAALAAYLQTEEARKAVQTQLIAQVAQGYYNLLMLHDQLKTAKQNLALNDSTLTIIREQYDVGDVTLLGLEQAEAQRLAAAALIPTFEQNINIQENALHILVGKFPDTLPVVGKLAEIPIPAHLTAGVPSALLARRPDVKQAELAVVEASAYTHVARASMYPSLSITAQGGVNAFSASNWFSIPASLFGAVAGNVAQPIFLRKRLKTNYEVAKIDQENAVIQFKQSMLTAVGEVSDALVKLEKLKQRQQVSHSRTAKLQQAIQHADLLFQTGMASYLEVITAQASVLQSELELAEIKKAQLDAMVDLYRSLGGGWM